MKDRAPFPLAAAALLVLVVGAGWWLRRPSMTSTPLAPDQAPLVASPALELDSGSHLVIATKAFTAELDATGVGRIAVFEHGVTVPRFPDTAAVTALPRPLALDSATVSRLFTDLGRARASWAARTAGEEAALDGGPAGPADTAPVVVVEEVRADRSTRLVLQLDEGAPELPEIDAALTPLRLAR